MYKNEISNLKALSGSQDYLKMIIESSLDRIAVLDEHGRFEFGNDSFFKIAGWPRAEIFSFTDGNLRQMISKTKA